MKKNKDLQEFLEVRSKISLTDTRVKTDLIGDRGSVKDMGYGHGRGQFERGNRSQRSARLKSQKSRSEKQSAKKDDGTVTFTEGEGSLEYSDSANLSFI